MKLDINSDIKREELQVDLLVKVCTIPYSKHISFLMKEYMS